MDKRVFFFGGGSIFWDVLWCRKLSQGPLWLNKCSVWDDLVVCAQGSCSISGCDGQKKKSVSYQKDVDFINFDYGRKQVFVKHKELTPFVVCFFSAQIFHHHSCLSIINVFLCHKDSILMLVPNLSALSPRLALSLSHILAHTYLHKINPEKERELPRFNSIP